MFRFLLRIAAFVSSFWLIGNLAIKVFGFAPEWSWWFTLAPFCATIPIGYLVMRVQRHDATCAQRDFMASFQEGTDRAQRYQGKGRVQIHDVTREDYGR